MESWQRSTCSVTRTFHDEICLRHLRTTWLRRVPCLSSTSGLTKTSCISRYNLNVWKNSDSFAYGPSQTQYFYTNIAIKIFFSTNIFFHFVHWKYLFLDKFVLKIIIDTCSLKRSWNATSIFWQKMSFYLYSEIFFNLFIPILYAIILCVTWAWLFELHKYLLPCD